MDSAMHSAIESKSSDTLRRLVGHLPCLALTGAGISAGTGIPTYRDRRGRWLRSDPIKHQEFIRDAAKRQRYWGRSMVGWPGVRDALPAPAHRSIARLQARGAVAQIVTQNVDRLHQRAGAQAVTDLHGRLDRVLCLDCGDNSCREYLQGRLESLNPWLRPALHEARPDGDADLPDHTIEAVRVPDCERCGGTLMPDVVFFGGSIPAARVDACRAALQDAQSLLVIGSSLTVYSGFRFCRWAEAAGLPIFLINPGQSRADAIAEKCPLDADLALAHLEELIA
ncbi:MAG: NAD-dependent protein deacetylase [Halieaceae bacterium]|jgi:NAD-dependent SIR2 family protein deacetylase|nr:NAD-dependent protein deacetylase [Halieaceae bacterium]